jgi:predicted dehydrogenase
MRMRGKGDRVERVRFGIVGLGIGKSQARAILKDPRGAVAALCDVNVQRMEEFAAELPQPVKRYTDYHALCADPEIDAIFVGTPNQLHVPVAMAAVRAGKHVLCTKPLSDSEGAARELVQAAKAAGVVNMMSLGVRFGNPVQYLGKLSRRGDLGEVYYARARSIRRSGIPDWGAHFIRTGGGAFRDMGVHALDAVWWLAGCPEPVSVLGAAGAKFGPYGRGYMDYRSVAPEFAAQYEADDYGAGLIRFANGAAIQIESFWASHQPEEFQIELFGTEGGARLDPLTLYRLEEGRPADTTVQVSKREGLIGVAEHFIACVLDGVKCEAPLSHGLVVQRMLEGVLKSGETGEEVRL